MNCFAMRVCCLFAVVTTCGSLAICDTLPPDRTGDFYVSDTGLLYVSSFNNDRVTVFEPDGTYVRSFTGGGLNGPNCVTFDSSGNIYVASALSNSLIEFDTDGSYVQTITEGQLRFPRGIAFVPVPEPSTGWMVAAAMIGSMLRRRRRGGFSTVVVRER